MKKVIISIAAVLLAGCASTQQVTKQQAKNVLHDFFNHLDFKNYDRNTFNAIITDNVKRGIANNGQGQSLYNFNLIPGTSQSTSIYSNSYAVINYANRVLSGVENLEFEGENQATEDHIEAQLLTLRAMSHFTLFQYYTEDYSDANSLAITIMDYVPEITETPERNTVEEVLEFIKADLNRAAELISPEASDYFYINI